MKNSHKCVDCMYCVWVDKRSDMDILFCENEMTKDVGLLVGFLDEDADACKYFTDACVTVFATRSFKIC